MSRKQQICRSPSRLMPTRPPPPNPTSVRYTDTCLLTSLESLERSHPHPLSLFAHQASNSRRYLLRVHTSPAFGTLDLMLKVTVIP
ncbi:hypothetical protein L1887_36809 [Cichorium endivia]|nr:hypothetical protein L1887_36809 [Cichorium endivia]